MADDEDSNEEVQKKTTIIVYERWWRSPAVCIFVNYLFYWFYLSKI